MTRSVQVLLGLLVVPSALLGQEPQQVKADKLGQTVNVMSVGSLYLAGQPQPDDIAVIAKKGVKRVITLRTDPEVKWDEAKAVGDAGMEFISIPVRGIIADEKFTKVRELLRENTPTLLHCGSAIRVGALWLPYRVLDQGVDLETAVKESATMGLAKGGYQAQALAYIKRNEKERSVKPGICLLYTSPSPRD